MVGKEVEGKAVAFNHLFTGSIQLIGGWLRVRSHLGIIINKKVHGMGMGPPRRPITVVLLPPATIRLWPPPRLPSATTSVSQSNGPPTSSPFWRSCSANKKIEVALQQVGFTNETIMHKRQDSGVPVYPYRYASERNIVRYAKIAMELKDKTVRDVALRCRWMNKKENGKRRKEDHSSTRKNKDKKEKVADPMAKSAPHATNRSNGPPYAQPVISMDSDDGISYKAIGGVTGELLEQNAHALDQISANFAAFKVHENINLFCQARNNILTIMNDMNDMPEIMKQMPPLPVKLNEELVSSILPRSSLQKNSLS